MIFYLAHAAVHILAASPSPGAATQCGSAGDLNPAACAPPGLDAIGSQWIAWVKWAGVVGGVMGLMACGIMMAVGRRNRSHLAGEGASGIPWTLAGLTIIALASGVVTSIVS